MTIIESIKFDKLKEENETLKKELAEKDKEIEELKQQQLFKEDFRCGVQICDSIEFWDEEKHKQSEDRKYVLKDSSKYDKLPNKEDK